MYNIQFILVSNLWLILSKIKDHHIISPPYHLRQMYSPLFLNTPRHTTHTHIRTHTHTRTHTYIYIQFSLITFLNIPETPFLHIYLLDPLTLQIKMARFTTIISRTTLKSFGHTETGDGRLRNISCQEYKIHTLTTLSPSRIFSFIFSQSYQD